MFVSIPLLIVFTATLASVVAVALSVGADRDTSNRTP
jgi:hypothetical protein